MILLLPPPLCGVILLTNLERMYYYLHRAYRPSFVKHALSLPKGGMEGDSKMSRKTQSTQQSQKTQRVLKPIALFRSVPFSNRAVAGVKLNGFGFVPFCFVPVQCFTLKFPPVTIELFPLKNLFVKYPRKRIDSRRNSFSPHSFKVTL